jgi:signal transduction histidine kinase
VQVRISARGSSLAAACLATPGVELEFEDVSIDLAVSGQPAQLQQVILNLCTNAAQAMEGGGCIRVTAKQEELAAPLQMSDGELSPGRYCLHCRQRQRARL